MLLAGARHGEDLAGEVIAFGFRLPLARQIFFRGEVRFGCSGHGFLQNRPRRSGWRTEALYRTEGRANQLVASQRSALSSGISLYLRWWRDMISSIRRSHWLRSPPVTATSRAFASQSAAAS